MKISEIFHLTFTDQSWPKVTENGESEITDTEGPLYNT